MSPRSLTAATVLLALALVLATDAQAQDDATADPAADPAVYEFGDDRFYKIEEDADEGEEQGVLYLQVVSDTLEAYLVGKTIAAFTDKTETTESHEERLADRIAKAEQEKVH